MTFEELVADWMRSHGYSDVVKVTRCDGIGSDWGGSTEDGFHETFAVDLMWLTPDDRTRFTSIGGEDMQSLWMHVVGAWSNDGR